MSRATIPVDTYRPVPIVAPMPRDISASGPSRRCSRSPEFISSIRWETGFRWNQGEDNHCIPLILLGSQAARLDGRGDGRCGLPLLSAR